MAIESDNTPPSQRIHLRAVYAIILAAVLGALAGWHGHKTFTGIAAVSVFTPRAVEEPRAVATTLPLRAEILERQLHFQEWARDEQLRSAEIQASLDKIEAHRQKREEYRKRRFALNGPQTRNPLVNADGTFNMRYHLPAAEQ